MAEKTHGERIDRLEQIVQILAEDQISLQKLIADLATETRRGFEQVSEQFKEIKEQFTEIKEQFKETDRRMRETDARIDKLVVAIGEFISRGNQTL